MSEPIFKVGDYVRTNKKHKEAFRYNPRFPPVNIAQVISIQLNESEENAYEINVLDKEGKNRIIREYFLQKTTILDSTLDDL